MKQYNVMSADQLFNNFMSTSPQDVLLIMATPREDCILEEHRSIYRFLVAEGEILSRMFIQIRKKLYEPCECFQGLVVLKAVEQL